MSSEKWVDEFGIERPERRVGDPWRRDIHGRVAKIERRLEDGKATMNTMARDIRLLGEEARDRDRILGSQIAHNTDVTQRIEQALQPIAAVFKDPKVAGRMMRTFQAFDGAHTLTVAVFKFLGLVAGGAAGIAVLVWVIVTLARAAK